MPDYSKGKIYRITSGDLTYIGSTCEPTLARRLAKHISSYKGWKNGKTNGCSSFQLIETGQYEITLIELCPCGSKDELSARERYWIENTVCVNKIIPGRTRQEYRDTHKETISDCWKTYYKDNKEELAEYYKTYKKSNKEKINEQQRERRARKYLL